MSDAACLSCGVYSDFGDIMWMRQDGMMFCPSCRICPRAVEYVVIEWPSEESNTVLHTAKAMELWKWR